jgi:DNA-directed RNA polymerase subunit M/transcription elongation factor TFIIS
MRMENPQRLTDIMVDNLEPPAFKDIIKMYVKEPKIKKKCKGNPLETNKLIQEKLKDFLMMNPNAVKTVKVKEKGKDIGKLKEKKKDESKDRSPGNKGSGERVRFPCLKCGSKDHMVRQCPQLGSAEEAEKLIQSAREKRQGQQSQ